MKEIETLLKELTLEEKVALVSGYNFMYTNPVPRLDIPSLRMSDGPHGLRIQGDDITSGAVGTKPATAFPAACTSSATWNPLLVEKMGNAMAEEAKYYGINIILGPGVNIKRNPLCGRNFEYFSEDPFLAGRFGASEVKGIQDKHVGVSVKHYAANNLENFRFVGDSIIDERALREVYLRQFEHIVKASKPETLMCSYNKINGVYSSENDWLLNKVLRDEWGFNGLVMSDWGTTHNRILGVKSGLDLEMPGDTDICRKWLYDAVNNGELSIEDLDKAVRNVLILVKKHENDERLKSVNFKAHHELAKEIALEGAILSKNDGTLPLKKEENYLVIGELFDKMRYQGAGSSLIEPSELVSPKDAFDKAGVIYKYIKGYKVNEFTPNEELINEAVIASKDYEKVVLFLGLTDYYETEGGDRENMSLPENQVALINALVKENKTIVVVLYGGSPVELPFFDDINALLNMYLPGQNGGEATYELLFGLVNPSGRYAETWPLKYSDVPFNEDYSKTKQEVYKESIYVGYRYYISKNKEVRFPFGYGLSYTTFEYKNLKVTEKGDELHISVDVTNTGKLNGNEIIQIYVSSPRNNTHKPLRELKGFTKVNLKTNETKSVLVSVSKEDLKYYSVKKNSFVLEDGEYIIEVGKNSRDIVLSQKVTLKGERVEEKEQEVYRNLNFETLTNEVYEEAWGKKIPELEPVKPFTLESRLIDLKESFMGKILYNAVLGVVSKDLKKAKKMPEGTERDNKIKGAMSVIKMMETSSLMTLSMSSGGKFSYQTALGFRDLSNWHVFKGIGDFCKKIKAPVLPINEKETK